MVAASPVSSTRPRAHARPHGEKVAHEVAGASDGRRSMRTYVLVDAEHASALAELQRALEVANWPAVSRARRRLDHVPLRGELEAVLVTRRVRPEFYEREAAGWLVRLVIEHRRLLGLRSIVRLVGLLDRIDQPNARLELAAYVHFHCRLDVRRTLGLPIPPKCGPHETFPDYRDRLKREGHLEADVAYERARLQVLRDWCSGDRRPRPPPND